MNKTEFLVELKEKLSGIPQNEAADRLVFYGEMIDDRVEDGLTEEEAIAQIGSVNEIASQILSEVPVTDPLKAARPTAQVPAEKNPRTVVITEKFKNINVLTSTDDVVFYPSGDDTCRIIFPENEKQTHSAEVQGWTLNVTVKDNRKWYDFIAFPSLKSTRIEIYLPDAEYSSLTVKGNTGDVSIPAGFRFESVSVSVITGDVECLSSVSGLVHLGSSTGDIDLKDISTGEISIASTTGDVDVISVTCTGNVEVKVTTGDISLKDVSCREASLTGTTSDIRLTNVTAQGLLTAACATGDVKLNQCDAAELSLKTNLGDITGSLRSEKQFIVKNGLGDAKVPATSSGGICRVSTDMGDINISI